MKCLHRTAQRTGSSVAERDSSLAIYVPGLPGKRYPSDRASRKRRLAPRHTCASSKTPSKSKTQGFRAAQEDEAYVCHDLKLDDHAPSRQI